VRSQSAEYTKDEGTSQLVTQEGHNSTSGRNVMKGAEDLKNREEEGKKNHGTKKPGDKIRRRSERW